MTTNSGTLSVQLKHLDPKRDIVTVEADIDSEEDEFGNVLATVREDIFIALEYDIGKETIEGKRVILKEDVRRLTGIVIEQGRENPTFVTFSAMDGSPLQANRGLISDTGMVNKYRVLDIPSSKSNEGS